MQSDMTTQPPTANSFTVWWHTAFAEFLAATKKRDALLIFMLPFYTAFMSAEYEGSSVLEVYLDELDKLVRKDQVDEGNATIFLNRVSPEGTKIADIVRTSGIPLARYPHAASFFHLTPSTKANDYLEKRDETHKNRKGS